MKKLKLTKFIASLLMATSILALNPIGASAEWRQDNIGWWNTEGNSYSIGWRLIDGNWYYFYSDGYMAKDTTIGGYYLNGSGVWDDNAYNDGEIAEFSGTVRKVEWERINGENMTSYVLELDTPANFNVSAYIHDNVNEIEICHTNEVSKKVNQHVNIKGKIHGYPGTPYYLGIVTIFDGTFS